MFNSIAHAADGAAAQGSPLAPFIPLILIFAIFYFLLIRPQQKKQKQHVAMLNSITAGDEIMTGGGMYGKVLKVIENNTFIVEIASGVTIKLAKNGIAQKVTPGTAPEETK
ncbi:preprotein translocase, YajC subunit [Denitrovibrio acetiphilus DSM 12809]|uniref:Sec translocon accessory complex subunit YajC n=1 Tax=Denitrovibrio acetiphilus (strain DSM 12809 / NBRC 114555 / N2460) TaxID=522772 RepID=D4H484_DENA2|nr:preprotein translocase subunit YajC [Denitrovibrio acetiphilus]ADD69213.1 preprotein translocase, YajC subunit [Denitrovibrio acetiphilus DSM 12809]